MAGINFGVPLSGLELQTNRLASSASNVANQRSAAPTGGDGDKGGFVPTRVTGVSAADGGVRSQQRPLSPASVPAFDPSAPDADENGVAQRPNVSLAEEAVVQIESRIAFEANLKALEAQDEQVGTLLDLTS